jgi:hypothetical protein
LVCISNVAQQHPPSPKQKHPHQNNESIKGIAQSARKYITTKTNKGDSGTAHPGATMKNIKE